MKHLFRVKFENVNQNTQKVCFIPATTLSIACSKFFICMLSFKSRAAIKAASLHTLAISAPIIIIIKENPL